MSVPPTAWAVVPSGMGRLNIIKIKANAPPIPIKGILSADKVLFILRIE